MLNLIFTNNGIISFFNSTKVPNDQKYPSNQGKFVIFQCYENQGFEFPAHFFDAKVVNNEK